MTSCPPGFLEAFQCLGQPICRAIARSPGPISLLSTDRRGSFLDLLLQSCSAGAPERIGLVSSRDFCREPELGPVDGLAFAHPDDALSAGRPTPRTGFATTLDRQGLLLPQVAAIALGARATAAKAWRGARQLIARDRPIFLAYAQGNADVLDELKHFRYVIRPFVLWAAPQAAAILVAAIPAEQTETEPGTVFLAPAAGRDRPHPRVDVAPGELTGEGLHPRNTSGDSSRIWTGPGRRTELALPQAWTGPQVIRLAIRRTTAREGMKSLSFCVNGRSVVAAFSDTAAIIHDTTPPGEFTGEARLTITTPDPAIPAADPRHQLRSLLGPLDISWF